MIVDITGSTGMDLGFFLRGTLRILITRKPNECNEHCFIPY